MNPGKQRINNIILLMLVLCTSRAFAYDYSWPVDYQIKNDSINEIDMIIQNHIYNTPELHVYEINWNTYALGIKEDGLKLLVYFDECIPFGNILEGKIYLKDVNAVVFFYLPQIQGKIICALFLIVQTFTLLMKNIIGKNGEVIHLSTM